MTKYYVDSVGAYIGGFDGVEPPAGTIEVPSAPVDARQVWDGSAWGEVPIPVSGKTYKADIWRRSTDAEAEMIVAVLSQQTIRKRRIFEDAMFLDHSEAEFAELRAGFVATFGTARAAVLLAPSE